MPIKKYSSDDGCFNLYQPYKKVLEHVGEPNSFVSTVSSLARPGGIVTLSTLNRTPKVSY